MQGAKIEIKKSSNLNQILDISNVTSVYLNRSFIMLLDSEVDVKGIKAYRYVIDPLNFAINEENEAFCVPNKDNCLPYGLLNVERCYGKYRVFNDQSKLRGKQLTLHKTGQV